MLVWQDVSPTGEGLCVVEWYNAGGFAVFDIREFDGILFAFHVQFANHDAVTRLDKWAIKCHVMLPHPESEVLETLFSRLPQAKIKAREAI